MKKIFYPHDCKIVLPVVVLLLIITAGCGSRDTRLSGTTMMKSLISKDVISAGVFLTSKDSEDRLTQKDNVFFNDSPRLTENFSHIIVDYNKCFQVIEGIGGALTDASAETFYKMHEEIQDDIITAYFDPQQGIGYSLCRTHINSCDFSSESYAYDEVPGDTALANFNISHDRQYRIPFIKRAVEKAGGELKLFASPWSPPAWMKTNNNMLQGGSLRQEYRKTWADYYIRFFEEYKKEGISFWGLTVQNEPLAVQTWESCIYSAEDELIFVRDYLGPRLQASAFADLKLMIWDHNRDILFHRANTILSDSVAAEYVWGTAFHWYMGDHFDNVKLVHDAFPDKGLLFSEGCGYPFSRENVKDWHWGEKYAEAMIRDFNNFTSGWTDWNILLDETGGPNHVDNFCLAPVICDTRDQKVHYMNSYYYIGHFSKFIRPGARRIACSSTCDDLLASAFINPDNSVSVVVFNKTENPYDFNLWIDNKAAASRSPSHSIITFIIP
ncbi:MAG: glycoside hydrolase family 30 protein [Bacteroidales bacterium]|nr:glycoside hydrolase family 30 protein [Bacteroidales bacterium]MBN2761736.1 glycoside hydrolase family 30 protein [Bacteroidales bacterium]